MDQNNIQMSNMCQNTVNKNTNQNKIQLTEFQIKTYSWQKFNQKQNTINRGTNQNNIQVTKVQSTTKYS